MKISIITAVYNGSATIADCIRSVNDQSYNNIEHIIIDGASMDNTVEIIKSIPNRVTKIISESDNGIYDAMNKGIKLATGDVIGILNSDDFYVSESIIRKIVDVFQIKNCSGVYGDLKSITRKGKSKVVRKWKSQPFKPKLLQNGWMPAHPTLFIKNEIYQKYGTFDLSYKIAADYDFMLRIFQQPDLVFEYLPEIIIKFREGGHSNGSLIKLYQKTKEDYHALKVNNIKSPYRALFLKKISKIAQYI